MARRSCLLLVATLVLLAGCGGQDSTTSAQTITYRLIPGQGSFPTTGSVITYVPEGLGIPPAPPAPLEGTFDVVPADTPALPHTSGFAYDITRLEFSGGGYEIRGTAGHIETMGFDVYYPLQFTATVTINGERVHLAGGGGSGDFTYDPPPTFTAVGISGGYYSLRISAAPVPNAGLSR